MTTQPLSNTIGAVGAFNASQTPAVSPSPAVPSAPAVPTPTPVAPVATPMAPTAPVAPISPTPTPPTGIQAPTAPATPVAQAQPKPATPAPTPAPTQGAIAPVPTPEQRTTEITAHLNEGLKNNPSLFASRDAYNQAYGYATKPANEQAVLDNFYNANQANIASAQTRSGYLDAFMSGQKPSANNTPAYISAQNAYNRISPYLSATPDILASAVSTQKVTSDDLGQIQKYAPYLYQAYQVKKQQNDMMNNINNSASTLYNSMNGTSGKSAGYNATANVNNAVSSIEATNKATLDNISNNITNGQDMANALVAKRVEIVQNDPQVLKAYPDYISAYNAVKQDKIDQTTLMDSIKAQYGTQPPGLINAIYNERLRAMQPTILANQMAYDTASANLNHFTQMASDNFDAYKAGYTTQEQQQFQANQMKQQQQYTQENAKYADVLKTGDVNSTDPYIQKVGIQNAAQAIYDKYGPIMQRSPTQITNDIQALMAKGMTFDQAMQQNVIAPLQAKPGFAQFTQAMQNKAVGIDNTPKVIGTDDWGKPIYGISDGKGGFTPINFSGGNTNVQTNTVVPSSTADFIKGKEGYRGQAYLDSAGVPTIGYGFTKVNGVPVKMGDTMDKTTADAQFEKQIAGYQNWSNYIDPSKLSDAQKTALTSFEYNLGSGIWEKNAMPILKDIENGDIAGAQKLMKQYTQAGGKYVQGLANRRNDEANLLGQGQAPISQGSIQGITNPFGAFTGQGGPVTTAPATVQPEGQKNKYTESQIQAFTNYINAGKVLPVNSLRSVVKQAGFSNPNDFYAAVDKFQQNPELTSIDKSYADSILNGNALYNAAKDPHGIMAKVIASAAADKGVDWSPYDNANQNKTKLAFSIGKYGNQITAADTALDHLALFNDYVTAQKNGDFPRMTKLEQDIQTAFGSDIRTGSAAIASKLGTELASAYGDSTVSGIENESKNISSALSNGQLASYVQATKTALGDKLNRLNIDQYKPTMGEDNKQIKSILDRINTIGTNTQSNIAPPQISTTPVTFKSSTGKSYTF